MTSPSQIYSIISQYEKQRLLREIPGSALYNHFFNFDAFEIRRLGYICAEVRADSLDKGYSMTDVDRKFGQKCGIKLCDDGAPLISARLGGIEDAYISIKSINISQWKSDEEKVYCHVQQRSDRYARLQYAIKYKNENKVLRPSEIYYNFTLYEDGEVVGQPIENIIENTPP